MTFRAATILFFGMTLSERRALVERLGIELDNVSSGMPDRDRSIAAVIAVRRQGLEDAFIQAVEVAQGSRL